MNNRASMESCVFLFTITMVIITSLNANGLRNMTKIERTIELCKSDILCLQETHWDNELVETLGKLWKGPIFIDNGSAKACGVAILVRERSVSGVKQTFCGGNGRVIAIEFVHNKNTYKLINIYAPNVEELRKSFFEDLEVLCTGDCMMVGDYNVKLSRLDYSNNVKYRYDGSRNFLKSMMAEHKMVDVWREENAERKVFSRRQVVMGTLRQSRIDLVLVKENIVSQIKEVKYTFTTLSDHAILSLRLRDACIRNVGGGMWCLNNSLLREDSYKEMIAKCIKEEMENRLNKDNICIWWENLKEKVKKKSIYYAKQMNFRMDQVEKEIQNKLNEEAGKADKDGNYNIQNYMNLRRQLKVFEKNKCDGAIVRSRVQYTVEGERCTAYFLNLEKNKQENNYINELQNENGEKVNDLVSILNTVEGFYKNLYKKGNTEKVCIDEVLSGVDARISADEQDMCDRGITVEEIQIAIKNAKNNKSPGSDGLSSEFYKEFADVLAPILLMVYQSMEEGQMVPESMATGVITILFKNRGSRLELGNYRPISLLNSDYKILTRVLAYRIKKVMGGIISPTQAYSVEGRDIADIIGTVRDVVRHMKEQSGIVLSIDLNKAFDRVEHEFLFRTMKEFGFGDRIVSWIRLLYKEAKSRVKCNGLMTDTFALERSVRQGCPLSALLYSMSIEPFAVLIKKDSNIKGIQIPGEKINIIQQYADDMTITVENMDSINIIMKHMGTYGRAAGAKVNIEKSELMCIGQEGDRVDSMIAFRVVDCIKVLGVNIGPNEKEARDITWTGVINKIKHTLNAWKQRKLKLKGKVIVVNSLLLSKCVYVLGALDLPVWVLSELNQLTSNFLWDGKGVRISHKTLIAGYSEGGLKLVDIDTKRKALRVKTVKKYLHDVNDYGWKQFFKMYVQMAGRCGENSLLMVLKEPMYEKVPFFYQEVFRAWGEFLPNISYNCSNVTEVMNKPVFLNPIIQHNNKMLYNKVFMDAGIRQVKDMVYEFVPGFLPGQAMVDCVREWDEDARRDMIVKMYDIIKGSMPVDWRYLIERECVRTGDGPLPKLVFVKNDANKEFKELKVKNIYLELIAKLLKRPASEQMWERVLPGMNVQLIWENLQIKYNAIECENNDFMTRHNRIYVNTVLHQINKENKRECDVCETEPEDLLHIYIRCECLRSFVLKLKDMLFKNWEKGFVKAYEWNKMLLFGVNGKRKDVNVRLFNFVLSHVRYAIMSRRNLAHFEGKKVHVWDLFESVVRRNVGLIFKYGAEDFAECFIDGCGFISVTSEGKLAFNF